MKRSLVAAAVAVVLAVFGVAAVLVYVSSVKNSVQADQEPVTVLVAKKRIPAGTTGGRVRDGGYVESVVMPRGSLPGDALAKIEGSLDNLVVTSEVQQRQLLLRGLFGEPSKAGTGIPIPEGKLAVNVPALGKCAGNIRPGLKLAFFETFTSDDGHRHVPDGNQGPAFGPTANHVTRLVLPRVEVIAVSTPSSNSGGGGNSSDTKPSSCAKDSNSQGNETILLTMAVSQDEAERLIHAMQTSWVYFAIVDDTSDVKPGPGVDTKSLFG